MKLITKLLNNEPVAIKVAAVSIIGACVASGWFQVSAITLAAWGVALENVLGLFVRAKSTPTGKVEGIVSAAVAAKGAEIHDFLAALPAKK